MRVQIYMLAALALATSAWAQEVGDEQNATENADVVAVEEVDDVDEVEDIEAVVEPDFDETGLDEQGFDNDDDDFRPTEEIPTDQSIPFPTDI